MSVPCWASPLASLITEEIQPPRGPTERHPCLHLPTHLALLFPLLIMLRGHRSCFRVMGMSRSSQPQGLNLLSTAWDALPAVPLIADPSSLSWKAISSEKTACALIEPSSRLWRGTLFLSWHISSSVIVCLLFTSCPNPSQTVSPMVFSALFLSWVWYYSTTSDTKRAVQEIFLKWVNSNEGISSQGQQTKCGLEVKRCWAWKPFPKKHFAPWSLWSYFYVFSRSLPPSTTPLKATSALEYFPLWRY